MSKYTEIFNYMKQCPVLNDLWSLSAVELDGTNVILPSGTSERIKITDYIDTINGYNAEIKPYPSVYEEYQINCYRTLSPNENEFNVLTLDQVQSICDWVIEQDEQGNLPNITGRKVVSIAPYPFNPQIRGVDDNNLICYFITIRITYVNPAKARSVEL